MTSLFPRPRGAFPSLSEWFEGNWPFGEHNPVRIEESMKDGNYIVRAELPGFDPDKNIHVTTEGGMLTISAEREARTEEQGRSEFRYGSFSRTVSLPQGADTSKISATYADGILEITVPYAEEKSGRQVEIKVAKS